MSAKFTRAPWREDIPAASEKYGYRVRDRAGRPVALVYFPALRAENRDNFAPAYTDEAKANARLVALAPETFEALRRLFSYIEDETLVRNIAQDGAPDWPLRMIAFVSDLKRAQEIITKIEAES